MSRFEYYSLPYEPHEDWKPKFSCVFALDWWSGEDFIFHRRPEMIKDRRKSYHLEIVLFSRSFCFRLAGKKIGFMCRGKDLRRSWAFFNRLHGDPKELIKRCPELLEGKDNFLKRNNGLNIEKKIREEWIGK